MDEDDRSSRSDKQKMHRMVVEIILPQSGFVQLLLDSSLYK
jgi:hypothetical protein